MQRGEIHDILIDPVKGWFDLSYTKSLEKLDLMALLLLLVSSLAISRRLTKTYLEPQGRWGKDVHDNMVGCAVCACECICWCILAASTEESFLSDLDRLLRTSAFTIAGIGALGTLMDLNGDTLFDSIRRLFAFFYGLFFANRQVILLSLIGILYRVLYGMGVADKAKAWHSPEVWDDEKRAKAQEKLNVLVFSIGTRGDVQPFIYLGQEMRVRGHSVTICALEKYRTLVERGGLRFLPAGIDDIEESKFWRKCKHVSEVMADSIPNFCGNFLTIGSALFNAASSTNADVLIVTSTAQSISLSISERLKIPTFVAKFAPDLPTRSFPAPGYEGKRSIVSRALVPAALFNLSSWYQHWFRIALASVRCKLGVVENKYRKEILNLPPLKGGIRLKEMGECPNLCAFSNVVVPTPRDWPGNCLVTGWWLPLDKKRRMSISGDKPVSPSSSTSSVSTTGTEEDHEYEVAEDVLQFVGDEKDVICVTFGSMSPTADAIGLVPLVLKACEKVFGVSCRVLIVGAKFRKHATVSGRVTLDDAKGLKVMVIDEAPYHKLFPLVRFVIHHGGAGTSASTLETHVPSLVIPILLWTDQPLWASQLELLGVGVHVEQHFVFCEEDDHVQRAALEAKFLDECQAALRHLAHDSEDISKMKHRERVGRLVGEENGVQKAADAIEHVLRTQHSSARLTSQ